MQALRNEKVNRPVWGEAGRRLARCATLKRSHLNKRVLKALLEAGVVEFLRRGDDEIGLGQIRGVEKRKRPRGLSRQVDRGQIVVNGINVVVPPDRRHK